jgi:leucyl aminopeptidase (aminopeptidase T)
MDKALYEAAKNALISSMQIESGERLLIVTDVPLREIATALFLAGMEIGADALYIELPEMQVNGEEPPQAVAELMAKMDAVICPASKSLTHTDARRNACAAGARVATMPGITKATMIRGMSADYQRVARLSDKVAAILNAGKTAHLTTPAGTDIEVPIATSQAISSRGLVTQSGSYGNLPSGEAFLMPEEGKANGVFVVDASMASIGITDDAPIRIVVRDGYATEISGGRHADKLKQILARAGTGADNLAELGVGTNYAAQICGLILEDEKVLGTAHLALGNNVSMGGNVNVKLHLDGVMYRPTLRIDGKLLLNDGKLMVKG